MGDPLSVAASVAGLLSLGLKSTEYLYNHYTACRHHHQDIAKIADQLGGLFESLQILDLTVRTRTWQPTEQSIIQSIERSITRSEDAINVLQAEVDKFKKESTDNWKTKALVVGRRAAYPFKRSTLEDLGDDVNDFRDNLSIALQALQLQEHQRTQGDIEEINTIVKDIQARSVSADLRQWLRAPDVTVNFNAAVAKRHPSTGLWFVQGTAFATWLEQDNSFLWLYGFAGCGKSVLCSTAIQHAFRRRSADTPVAFFFFDFRDESKQDVSALLRALLFQFCGQVPALQADLTRLKDSYNQGTPPVMVLLEYLRQVVCRCRHTYILLDALDESPMDHSRSEVLAVIDIIRQWELPGLHLLASSRDVPDIRDQLQFSTTKQDVEHVSLKNDSVQQDIARFVAFQVDHDSQLRRWGEHREKIKSYLTQHADGVFRWVECQLRPLRKSPKSEKCLEKCLRRLPLSLDETYERMLCSIEFQQEARQILSLLCYSLRPLCVSEVTEALAVDIDDLERYDPRSRFTGGVDDLLRICPGLIEIILGTEGDEEVRIAHFSVQEYLLSDRIRHGCAAHFALSGPLQHGRISKACLLYLQNDDLVKKISHSGLVEQYAFAGYAAQYWCRHYRQTDSQSARDLLNMVSTLFTRRTRRECWTRLHNPDSLWFVDVESDVFAKDNPSEIYYASLLGLDEVVASILSTSTADIDAQGGQLGTALQAASVFGFEKIVQLLLDKGANVNAQGGYYGTALQAASVFGYEKIVQLLLDKGANINAQEDRASTALQAASIAASIFGYEKIVQLLLNRGANINAQGDYYGTALQAASTGGYEKIVQLLLDKGANVNAQEDNYKSALQAASVGGYEKIVQLLLNKDANVNTQGGHYGTALQAASAGGYEKIVQLLLNHDANVNAQGGLYSTALQAASIGGHEKIVQMLLNHGADTE